MKITVQAQGGLGVFALRPFTRSLDVDVLPDDEQAQVRALIAAAQEGGPSPVAECRMG